MKKKTSRHLRQHDPFADREAAKYEHPIPSREYILHYLNQLGQPATVQQLVEVFDLQLPEEQDALSFRLKAMLRDAQLMRDRRGRYCLIDKLSLLAGHVVGHPDGYGFFVADSGGEDLYLSARQMRMVMHGDRVLVRKITGERRNRAEAVVQEVIERQHQQLVGHYFCEQGITFVAPDNKRITQDIYIPPQHIGEAEQGQMVVAEIISYPSYRKQAVGRIVEILGEHMAPGLEIDVAIRSHGLPHQWPEQVLEEIADLPEEVEASHCEDRTDLRHLPFVTIDGEDAKDFDDAVYCEVQTKGGWCLSVAIADVSHYVTVNSALDTEACQRGNSAYFPGRVVPMLPEALSNGLCSLKPRVDRFCLVCEMEVTEKGCLSDYRFYSAVINSHARLTYKEVAAVLDGDQKSKDKHKKLLKQLTNLYDLYKALFKARQTRGAIDFDLPETRIVFDKDKKIKRIVPLMRNDAHRLIEECMLLANVATASFLQKSKLPGLYRVHDRPSTEKLEQLHAYLGELGLTLKGGDKPEAKHYQRLLHDAKKRPDLQVLQLFMLRSLSQAIYSEQNVGHFGLSYPAYTHFTSPIRRYPDLIVHRMIYHLLQHKKPKEFPYSKLEIKRMAQHCSETERRADEATRDVVDWLKCEYMQDKLGEEFSGTISTVTGFGIFVQLDSIYVEGLVHVTGLKNDYYQFDATKQRLIGERTHTVYHMGDAVRIRVARVDLEERKIDFDLLEKEGPRMTRGN